MGGRNLFMALRPVGKDRCSHTSVSLTGDFLRSAKLRRSLAHQIKHSFLVNGRNNRSVTIKQASNSLDSPRAVGSGVRFLRQATSEPLMYARDEKFCIKRISTEPSIPSQKPARLISGCLSTDSRSTRQFFHTVGDNRSQLHYLLAQFRVFRNVALNAIAIALQLSAERLKLSDETINFVHRCF